ncbi:TonB-dependent receptor [Arcicella rosea]|uniref:TonB-linked SusC/RagA family outer membrane protein n=1 Tax=Arcicella rosea TaxID=502909 RepID=A0A841EKF5_9BACT|nr:TonB-dependent receptor [Arcicella rosea]MBB6004032.1 TonB-linked SusC/RagA family outer membrane protein [Arcicella rosea]
MNKKLLLISFVFLLLLQLSVKAQDRIITGKVSSAEDGSALPGVSIIVKGTSKGVTSFANGTFKINASPNSVLVFSFVGFEKKEVLVSNQSQINVSLKSSISDLDEVVVIGYGVQKKSKLTSSISSISGKDITDLNTASFDQQLAGRASGVQVTVGSGIIGQAPRIRIRGTNSITSGGSPLIVVDGVPAIDGNQSAATPTNPLADINPADIESMEILKDGAATAIYGSRATNGVILVTTKKGKKGTPLKVNLSMQYGTTNAINRLSLLDANQFVTIANEKLKNAGGTNQAFLDANGTNTDWQSIILRQGITQGYNMSFSGGVEKTNYYFSLGYNKQEGAITANGQKRYNFTSNIDHSFNKYVSVGTKLQVTRTENTGLNTGTNALSGNLTGAARLFPNVPIYSETNPTGYNISPDGAVLGQGANTRNIDNNYTNIAFVLANNKFNAQIGRVLSTSYLQVTPFKGLTLKSMIGIDYTDVRSFQSTDPRHGDGRGSNGVVSQTSRNVTRWNWQNTANYSTEFGKNSIDLTVGTEYQKQTISSFTAQAANFSDRFFQEENIISGSFSVPTVTGGGASAGFDSYFGRLQYDYDNKYFMTFSARNDGISALPEASRRGNFFGGSLAYKLSNEDFYKNSSIAKVINDIKLRGSYAQVGNVNIGNFPYLGLFGTAQYGSQNGIGFTQAGNAALKWESSTQSNYGVDLGFLDNKIIFSAEYYKNDITDLILAAPTAPSLGVPNNSISKNVGAMYNKGLEFNLSIEAIKKGDFSWDVNMNYSTQENKVTALNKGIDGKDQPIFPSSYHIITVGQPVAALYGYETAGVNPANGFPLFVKGDGRIVQRNANTGVYSFYDAANPSVTTNTTGASLLSGDVADGGDRRVLGNTNPTWFGSVTNSFKYKGFDLEIFTRFSGGNKIMNITRQETLLNQDFNNNGTEILNRWTTEGQITDVPKMVLNNGNIINLNGNATTRFVEKGDFIRIQNIILGYTLPKSIITRANIGINSVRIYGQVQNAFTFTSYKGLDPELNSNGDVNQTFGIDYNTNPQFRILTFGLNVGF